MTAKDKNVSDGLRKPFEKGFLKNLSKTAMLAVNPQPFTFSYQCNMRIAPPAEISPAFSTSAQPGGHKRAAGLCALWETRQKGSEYKLLFVLGVLSAGNTVRQCVKSGTRARNLS
jgi:hypothetical protein